MQNFLIPLSGQVQQITTSDLNINNFKSLTIFGYSGFATGIPVNNVANVYVGHSTGFLPIAVNPGTFNGIDISAIYGQKDNLSNFWAIGNSGDGLFCVVY